MTQVVVVARGRGIAHRLMEWLTDVPTVVQVACGTLFVAFYAQRLWTVYRDTGLFRRIGFDWGLFYGQASALARGDIAAMYDVDRLGAYVQRLAVFTTTPDVALVEWPAPYPPLLATLMLPLTSVWPPAAFGIWTVASLAAAGHLVWRCSQLLPRARRVLLIVILLTALPVMQTLVLGQPVLLLASATAESLLALRLGADLRAGAWLGVLAFKPQYALLLGAFLIWKRRWRAVGGAVAVGLAILGASLLAVGWEGLLGYQRTLSSMSDFRDVYANGAEMVNWRALILNARPSIGNESGVALFALFSAGTLAALVFAARGAWRPATPALDLQLAAVMVATILVSYHSHMHGMVLLAVPLALLWRLAEDVPSLRLATLGVVFGPTLMLFFVHAILLQSIIDYQAPLWVVWPVAVVALLAVLLWITLRELRCWRSA